PRRHLHGGPAAGRPRALRGRRTRRCRMVHPIPRHHPRPDPSRGVRRDPHLHDRRPQGFRAHLRAHPRWPRKRDTRTQLLRLQRVLPVAAGRLWSDDRHRAHDPHLDRRHRLHPRAIRGRAQGAGTVSTALAPVRRRRRRGPRALDWLLLAAIVVGALAVGFPFLLILLNSFKSPEDYATSGPLALPTEVYWDGLVAFWERVNFPQKLWNSFWIAGSVAVFAVLISVLSAFAIGIGRVKGRTWIVVAFLFANLLPQEALLYPLYFMFKQVG